MPFSAYPTAIVYAMVRSGQNTLLDPEFISLENNVIQALGDGTFRWEEFASVLKKQSVSSAQRLLSSAMQFVASNCGLEENKRFVETHGIMATASSRNSHLQIAMELAMRHNSDEDVFLYLCSQVPSEMLKEPVGELSASYLQLAVIAKRQRLVRTLAEEYPFMLESPTTPRRRPLFIAARTGNEELVEYLYDAMLKRGWEEADILYSGGDGPSLQYEAASSNNPELLAFVVEKARRVDPLGWFKCPIEARFTNCRLAHVAARFGALKCLRWLMRQWPETFGVNVVEKTVGTTLHFAVSDGAANESDVMETVQFLVESGANVTLRCKGATAAERAQYKEHYNVAAYLKKLERAEICRRRAIEKAAKDVTTVNLAELEQAADAIAQKLLAEEEDRHSTPGSSERSRSKKKNKKRANKNKVEAPLNVASEDPPVYESVEVLDDPPTPTSTEGVEPIQQPPSLEEYLEAHAPDAFICPISFSLMDDPVLLVGDGCTYSRRSIEEHLDYCRSRKYPRLSSRSKRHIHPVSIIHP